MKFLPALLLISSIYLLFAVRPAAAQTMENGFYRVQMGNFNSISGESSGSNYNLSITSGETTPGLFKGENYTVKSGFQYVPRSSPFTFSVSSMSVDFGLITPTNPVTRTTTLNVRNTDAAGFNVTAAEDHELQVTTTGATIPDTTCDDGGCSESRATKWGNTLTYGFGYRCDSLVGNCVKNDFSFSRGDFYKQFSNSSKNENASAVLSGDRGNFNGVIKYKVNISTSQPPGVYNNTITYLATPNY